MQNIESDKQNKQYNEQINIHPDLQHIRTQSILRKTLTQRPQIQKMLTGLYKPQEIDTSISRLKNHKSHGMVGIPGEEYKSLKEWISKPILQMIHKHNRENTYRQTGKKEQ